ncbi:MAG TPA: ABC transporter permease [Burkholderiales bacterium]|nr:ABC transporter permease [Burkholderiales bacterium]
MAAEALAVLARTRASGAALIAALLVLWQVSALYWVSSPNWPPVSDIVRALGAGALSGELAEAFGSSLYRMLAGYAIGVVAAVALGLVMAGMRLAYAALEPAVELARPIPIPAIIPPLILLLGVDDAMKIFIVAFSAFFPVLVNTIAGVRAVDPVAIAVAQTFNIGRLRTALRVVLPASLPYILAGMRVSLALALIVTVVAEMIAGSAGVGYYIMTMQYALRASDMYGAIFLLAALGYFLNRGFLAVERRILHWYHL